MLEKTITMQFLKSLEHIEFGAMHVTTPDGKQYSFYGKQPGAHATLHLHDWRVIRQFASKGDTGFAEAYRDGWWDSDDLVALMTMGLQNEKALNSYIYGGVFGRIAARISYLFTRNTLNGSKKNIQAHYDLGNDFYKLWLDESMTYSSALFEASDQPFVKAQHNKYDRILSRLPNSGSLLEVGCGWGGFAERALQKNDYAIKGLTISSAQHEYAHKRVGKDATIALEDYRIQQGKYDNIVSIEMFEAVGEKYWPTYFGKLQELLASKGKAVIQTITIKDEYFESYRRGGDMIRTYIFPGGMLPSPTRFKQEAAKAGLRMTDSYGFGKDYALTLQHWLNNFEAKLTDVKNLGFDNAFIRMWRFYLTCCIASFNVGRTDVMQVELQHAA
ncbi:MAG: class I SAM-dependent methyltransferase [Alphaproteobacteria bacterium]